ncbi:MAG: double-strand break repair protein AddB [Sphingorhabdus sp.]
MPIGIDLASALSDWLVDRYRDDPLGLADVLLLLPNNRAITALTTAFVRSADAGLVLPRMVAIGDLALDEKLGPLLDPIAHQGDAPLPPVNDAERLLHMVSLVRTDRPNVSAAEALYLARRLIETFNELEIEEKSIRNIDLDHDNADLAAHWSTAYDSLKRLCGQSEKWLKSRQLMAPPTRRNALLYKLCERLSGNPPTTPVIAAGITTAAPAIARLLSHIAKLPDGLVLLPHLNLSMSNEQWDALGDVDVPPDLSDGTKRSPRQEAHPQYHLKLLLHRMGIARDEVDTFSIGGVIGKDCPIARIVQQAFCIPDDTIAWQALPLQCRTLDHVRLIEAEDQAEEAQAIAILIREAIEQPGKRIALATPDRELARRVVAKLRRWNIEADDSAGEPLSKEPVGMLFLTISQMLARELDPIALLAAFKHPLVRDGETRQAWLAKVRALDLLLRGPQLLKGAKAITDTIIRHVDEKRTDAELIRWWAELEEFLRPNVETGSRHLTAHLDAVAKVADYLTDGAIWKGIAGRCLAQFVEEYGQQSLDSLSDIGIKAYPDILATFLDEINIRYPYGRHPRVSIYGLIEARLQSADLLICAGLNEGTWPQVPDPDPWLAPHLRRKLDLPGIDRNIGLSAHDLASALGASQVVLTRARRDRSGPTIASRFLLRLQALIGENLHIDSNIINLAHRLHRSDKVTAIYPRPAPMPSAEQRRITISITQMDVLKSDPYAFYARNILKLDVLRSIDADADPAWRGTLVHKIIEDWTKKGRRNIDSLVDFAENMLADHAVSPTLRLLWQPRIVAGLQWVATETERAASQGRTIEAFEIKVEGDFSGIKVHGRIDRVDRATDGRLVIIDYKTGSSPAKTKIASGYALQLGLAGRLIETGGSDVLRGAVGGYEYWSLAKNKAGDFGSVISPFAKSAKDNAPNTESFAGFADRHAKEAIDSWILGNAPFTAKLKPEYAAFHDYDQLMRLDEWLGQADWEDGHES